MSRLRVHCLGVSLDGFAAGPDQGLDNPLGAGGEGLHEWFFPTRIFRSMFGKDGETGVDNDFAERGFDNIGAWILGRNMFSPFRGPWSNNESWKGWWGDNPPYHVPVFVLTHHARAPIEMDGGTTFHFVTGGIHEALDKARQAANGRDVRIGGGADTIRQYLRERLVDEMHYVISPVLLGGGETLFGGLDMPALGYRPTAHVPTAKAAHVVLSKTA